MRGEKLLRGGSSGVFFYGEFRENGGNFTLFAVVFPKMCYNDNGMEPLKTSVFRGCQYVFWSKLPSFWIFFVGRETFFYILG